MNTLFSPTVTEALSLGVFLAHPKDATRRYVSLMNPVHVDFKTSRAWNLSAVEWHDMVTAVDAAFAFLANPYNTEANTEGVLAFSFNAAKYCVDHGKVLPHGGEGDDYAYPTHSTDAHELSAVEYCDRGHSFCGNCGTDLDGQGSQDADIKGHFARCWNCHEEAVYVDGEGYSCVYRWADVLDRLKVQAYGVTADFQTDSNGYTTVDAVTDLSGTTVRTLRAFLAFLPHDPAEGNILLLVNGDPDAAWSEAHEEAVDHFGGDQNENIREDVTLAAVALDQVWFTSK